MAGLLGFRFQVGGLPAGSPLASLFSYPNPFTVRPLSPFGGRDLRAQRLMENGRQSSRTLSVSHCKHAMLAPGHRIAAECVSYSHFYGILTI